MSALLSRWSRGFHRPIKHSALVTVECLLHDNSFEILADVEFTMTPEYPATWDEPAGGGEIEVTRVRIVEIDPATKLQKPIDAPQWLIDRITENLRDDELRENAEPDDDEPEYER